MQLEGGRLEGRRVLLTGAASGIGLATAKLFLAEGAGVALLDIDADGLEKAGTALEAEAFAVDVADAAAVAGAVERAAAALGGLDGVVNAAGIDLLAPFDQMTTDAWRRVMAVNLDGPMHVCQAAVPHLRRAGGGTVVAIASGAGLRPLPDRTAYCAAKAGLVMFAKALAVDLAADEIRVNAICPGIIDTPLFRQSFEDAADPEAELAMIKARYALGRVGTADDIARAALYLSSAESAYVTGTALAVDGGRTFH